MAQERLTAELLTGYKFFHHPDMPTLGFLRLDTKGEPVFVMVTRKGLLELAKACEKHADDLQDAQ